MLRNNRYFLDPSNIIEVSAPEQILTAPSQSIQGYEHLTTATILQLLAARIISSKVNFGACISSSGISDFSDTDIIYSLELTSQTNHTETLQFKISIEDLTSSLIDANHGYLVSSDKSEELILISNSFYYLSTKIKKFAEKYSTQINDEAEKDTPNW